MPEAGEYERLVFYDPPDAAEAHARLAAVRPAAPAVRGRPRDARMVDAFARCVRARGRPGGDRRQRRAGARRAPTCATPSRRSTRPTSCSGPAHDGGYYLIALREPRPELFEAITWSTPGVLAADAGRAPAAAGSPSRRLAPLRDVDTLDDVRAEWPVIEALLRSSHPVLAERVARALATPGTAP